MAETSPTPTSPPPSHQGSELRKLDWRRPNHLRAIEVFGEFTDDLGSKVLSEINVFRSQSTEPITVFINSNGGSALVLKYINGFLDCQDLDGRFCRTVTVASGTAASAGAILLAFGDYAYAYEHSYIHFHGVRTSELPERFEDAMLLLGELDKTQREVVNKLSRAIIGRVIYRYQKLKHKFHCRRKDVKDRQLIELRCFIDTIRPELSTRARQLVERTYKCVEEARSLTQKILPKAKPGQARSPVRSDAKVLVGVIQHDIAEYEKKKRFWRIDERGISKIFSDYLTVRDYQIGEHWGSMTGLMRSFGEDFMSREQCEQFRKLDSKEGSRFLVKTVAPKIEPLWYYTVSLCKSLFGGENRLTPADAYWMGIIDEVIGTDLVGFRAVVEERGKQKPPASSSNAPPPPSGQSLSFA
ncbi:MAG: ATP-dependent Clp protease proteolytic subunit [Verrucomicrobia bacterium]|nr:ATP-dependent Clp protease proteolytic subunit [Verrucomicrobiota bacterium]